MPRGGKREGAGRKVGTKEKQTISKELAREALRQIVLEHMQEMTEAQIKHAKGIKYLVKRAKAGGKFEKVGADTLEATLEAQDRGEIVLEIWDKDPSVQAFTDLMNRALDKPKEQEQEHAVKGDLVIRWKSKSS